MLSFPSPTMSEANSMSSFFEFKVVFVHHFFFSTIRWVDQSIDMIVLCLTYCESFDFKDCLCGSGCPTVINDLASGRVICCMEVGYNGILDILGVAWLACDVVDCRAVQLC
jgi:hypothetical protein